MGNKGNNNQKNNIVVYSDGAQYEGEFKENLRHGFGVYTFKNKDRYEG